VEEPTHPTGAPARPIPEEEAMNAKDDLGNAAERMTGKVKEGIGKMTDNERLEAEGKADQVKADAKKAADKVKDAFEDGTK
jgi:uncharacterized protein YjbJ (UPF0337 family)